MPRPSFPVARVVLVTLAVVAAAALGGHVSAQAPSPAVDHCSGAPDQPLGWDFSAACEGHDACWNAMVLDGFSREGFEACDQAFLDALLHSPHLGNAGPCGQELLCRPIAIAYYHVVHHVIAPVARALGPAAAG